MLVNIVHVVYNRISIEKEDDYERIRVQPRIGKKIISDLINNFHFISHGIYQCNSPIYD
jgi:hypothetical protein